MLPPPLPDRNCGACTACCVHLAIDDPELTKRAGDPCIHMRAGSGCAIHAHHPATCRSWFCGWRFLHLSDAMRPDLSHILLVPAVEQKNARQIGGLKIVLVGERRGALANDELLNFIAKCVAGGVPIYLTYGTGEFAKQVAINETAKDAVQDGNKGRFLEILHGFYDAMAGVSR